MRAGRSEVIDLFSKWFADKSLVRCEGNFSKVAFSLRGRIFSISDQELKILSDDRASELVVRFAPEMEFGYGDFRNAPPTEKQYESCVVIFFSPVPPVGEPDTIAVAALHTEVENP